ncbi:M28 family metallopeptidase [Nocardioides donggukensis]|uniref:M20/M25/M40 family metallo-hydrolase n=1 Tax=Nocardioides donggukensis TaxID=2774019 RepID=A0A927K1R8_9ACTN|nr:M28 family metallopeptidase [Nocardioides donggukensis]MBD8868057.1 M20/M25/M40 family metallo-hydrolase [Nocardioides donggukensis]
MSSRTPSSRRLARPAPALLAGLVVALAGLPAVGAATATAAPAKAPKCEQRTNNTLPKLLECVTLDGVREHQQAFQDIADANDDEFYPGSRVSGTKGYADSVAYVADTMRKAGYDVTLDPFEFDFVFPALLRQLTPVSADYETGTYTGSGDGDVTGGVIGVDLALDPPRASDSGCEAADFNGLDFSGPNDIALIQRGTCAFAVKALNAEAAGAEAVVIFNQGNDPTREGLIVGTLGDADVNIPVVGASFADGVALSQAGSTARVRVLPSETRTVHNVIAEKQGKTNPDNIVMSGAHLDSVESGPGINDNGSGSAALLETAQQMSKVKPVNTIRFAWWGAEEAGLLGSQAYVDGLSDAEKDNIALYLNYDMVGSPNHVQMVYDANESTFPAPAGVPIPEGSEAIENLFERFYTSVGEPYDDAQFSGRSDYQAFIEAGIPAGGLFTGAEVIKTEEQAAIWGGTAGDQFDPCYHSACDTIDNVNLDALDVNSDVIAFAQLAFSYSTESVNGVKGKDVPGGSELPEPAGPEGTFTP